jgi:hypothetical protein
MKIEQVDSYNLMAIAILEHFGNPMPSEESISIIEGLLKKSCITVRTHYPVQRLPIQKLARPTSR